jgi:hypothetical protein
MPPAARTKASQTAMLDEEIAAPPPASAPTPMPKMKQLGDHPARDLRWEKILTDREFDWEFVNYDMSQIDVKRSRENQARIGKPIDDELVNQYVIALENGDVFPAIVLAEGGNRKALVVDGNHRDEAHRQAKETKIWAYVIKGAPQAAITLLTYEANAKHGKMTSEHERLVQAMHLIDGNVSAEEAARRLGLPVSKVRDHASMNRVDQRADEVGISRVQWDQLPAGTKKRLGQITTDEGFTAASKLALDAKLPTAAITKIVSDLNQPNMRSSSKQAAHVSQLRAVYRDTIQTGGDRSKAQQGRQGRPPRVVYGMALQQLDVLPSAAMITARMTESEKAEWARRTEGGIERLKNILAVLRS